MDPILAIETTSDICSVALISNKGVTTRQTEERRAHASMLVPLIQELLNSSGSALSGVAVSAGPGSYTGLRIGVSTAKGLAWAKSVPFYAISTLESQIGGYMRENMVGRQTEIASVIRARGEEVFFAFFNLDGGRLTRTTKPAACTIQALRLPESALLVSHDNVLMSEVLQAHEGVNTAITPLQAENMAPLLLNQSDEYHVKDLSSFEPFYLREFIAKRSTKTVFERLQF